MMLSELMPGEQLSQDVRCKGLTDNSRTVKAGDIFFAYPGLRSDGRDYAVDAISRGAVAVISEQPAPANLAVPVVEVTNLNQRLGHIAARYHRDPSRSMQVIAVTGTNGKTSFTHFLADALNELGLQAGIIGTMGSGLPRGQDSWLASGDSLTTPPAIDMQAILRELLDLGCQAVAIEASSHGLDQGRLNGTEVDLAVLTNLTHDHLDYHGSRAGYEAAKARLFSFPELRARVINLDDDFGCRLHSRYPDAVTYSAAAKPKPGRAQVSVIDVQWRESGLSARLDIRGNEVSLDLPLYGSFNLQNLLAVAASLLAVDGLGAYPAGLIKALGAIKPVKGRMERLALPRAMPDVFIDYAHTPDALQSSLQALKQHFPGRAITLVFGCGGDRDKAKRPLMGKIATDLAQQVIVTSDNPRHENQQAIIKEVLAGMPTGMQSDRVQAEPDRMQAIVQALELSGAEDLVLIAGKGHETYQLIAGQRQHFSDHEVVMQQAELMQGLTQEKARQVMSPGKTHLGQASQPGETALTGQEEQGYSIILGLGQTGLSYARHLAARGVQKVQVMEDKPRQQRLAELQGIYPDLAPSQLDEQALKKAAAIYLSPGFPLDNPALQAARQAGAQILGDVGIFGQLAKAPVIAVTGTNGKSTVARLIHDLFQQQQAGVRLGGNIGTPCLDLLDDSASLYVLEASSFQLELARDLASEVALVLNLSPDHQDRYSSLADYYRAKLGIYDHCRKAVVNRSLYSVNGAAADIPWEDEQGAEKVAEQGAVNGAKEATDKATEKSSEKVAEKVADKSPVMDAETLSRLATGKDLISIGYDKPDLSAGNMSQDIRFVSHIGLDGDAILLGDATLLTAEETLLKGRHNLLNMQAALATGLLMGLDLQQMIDVVRQFKGLPHRGELVAESNGVRFINDSKATNPGATLASVKGFANGRNVRLLLGGDGKGLSFAPVSKPLSDLVRKAYVYGACADDIAGALAGQVELARCNSLEAGVAAAAAEAEPGDLVLLAPGCASLDEFENFAARGDAFRTQVKGLVA